MTERFAWLKAGPFTAFLVTLVLSIQTWSGPARSGSAEDLTVGEAYYMVGNLAEASQRLLRASETGEPIQAYRALYLLGRISLLTGDFRQAKEYFERAVDGNRLPAGNWMALAGIGDALYAGGIYEEAIRRYRIAQGKAGGEVEKAIIDLKMALCQNALGKDEEARLNLRAALKKIPVLSGWVGQEE